VTRVDPATQAAWNAYARANEAARRDYDLVTTRVAVRRSGACNACGQPVYGSALYCDPCRTARRRATYRRSQQRRRGDAA
jgi:hypothetical protein